MKKVILAVMLFASASVVNAQTLPPEDVHSIQVNDYSSEMFDYQVQLEAEAQGEPTVEAKQMQDDVCYDFNSMQHGRYCTKVHRIHPQIKNAVYSWLKMQGKIYRSIGEIWDMMSTRGGWGW